MKCALIWSLVTEIVIAYFPVMEELVPHQNTHIHSPKVWHAYTRKIASLYMEELFNGFKSTNIVQVHYLQIKQSQTFLKFARNCPSDNCDSKSFSDALNLCSSVLFQPSLKSSDKNCYSINRLNETNCSWWEQQGEIKKPLFKPTGFLLCKSTDFVRSASMTHLRSAYKLPQQYFNFQFGWSLKNLYETRDLMVLEFVKIPSSDLPGCYDGKFEIYNGRRDYFDPEEHYVFCGVQSNIFMFLPFQNSMLEINVHLDWYFSVIVFISQMDDLIKSTYIPYQEVKKFSLLLYCAPKFNRQVEIFWIVVQKFNTISLKLYSKFHQRSKVIDGPSLLSPVIPDRGEKVSTSTFQCYLIVFGELTSSKESTAFFAPQPLTVQNISVSDADKSVLVPNMSCLSEHSNICGRFISTQLGLQLNITILQIIFGGNDTSSCLFGGLAIAEVNDDKAKEITSLCNSERTEQGISRSVYSNTHSVILVLYQYPGFSHISVNISVESTPCKHVHLDPTLADLPKTVFATFFHEKFQFIRFVSRNMNCVIIQVLTTTQSNMFSRLQLIHKAADYDHPTEIEQHVKARLCFELENGEYTQRGRQFFSIVSKVNEVHFEGENKVYKPAILKCGSASDIFVYQLNAIFHRQIEQCSIKYRIFPNFHIVGFVYISLLGSKSFSWIDNIISIVQSRTSHTSIKPHKNLQMFDTFMDTRIFWPDFLFKPTVVDTVLFLHQINNQTLVRGLQRLQVIGRKRKAKIYNEIELPLQMLPSGYELSLQADNFIYFLSCQGILEMTCVENIEMAPHMVNESKTYSCSPVSCNSSYFSSLHSCQNVHVFLIVNKFVKYSHYHNCNFSILNWHGKKRKIKRSFASCFASSKSESFFMMRATRKISWLDAKDMCDHSSHHLPSFHSQQQLDKLMALIRLSSNLPLLEGLYIGLIFSQKSKVRKRLLVNSGHPFGEPLLLCQAKSTQLREFKCILQEYSQGRAWKALQWELCCTFFCF